MSAIGRSREPAVAAVLALCVTSCDAPGPFQPIPIATYEDEFVVWDVTGYMDVAHMKSGDPTGLPAWNGIDPAYSGMPVGGDWSCPDVSGSVMVLHTVQHGTFILSGIFSKITNTGTRNGYPTAKYQVPFGDHYNTAATWYISGGVVDVECRGGWLALGSLKMVWVGNLDPYRYSGGVSGPSNSSPGVTNAGWGYHDDSNGSSGSTKGGNGSSTTWSGVLNHWMSTGECTPGWTLFVDNARVCSG